MNTIGEENKVATTEPQASLPGEQKVVPISKPKTVTKKPAAKKPVAEKPKSKKTKPHYKSSDKDAKEGYGVNYLAKQLEKKPNLIRILLRDKKIKRPGKSYIWPSKSAADAVVKKLKAA